MDIPKKLHEEFKIGLKYIENTIALIDEGNTIPFIARYRKELTSSLNDQVLRELSDRLAYLRNLDEKREQVRKLIAEQEKLTAEIEEALSAASTITEIDDIYRPFRPKRRTRAIIAKEKGLEPLAADIYAQSLTHPALLEAEKYIDAEKEVLSAEDALNGAKDIIAEMISDNADIRAVVRDLTAKKGLIISKAAKEDAESVYEMYYDYSESVSRIPGHRILAINRGEKEDFLSVKLEAPAEEILSALSRRIITKNNEFTSPVLSEAIEDSYKRLIEPSIEREIRNNATEKAEEGAIKVFGENLKQLLLQPPIKDKVVLALDPGYRNGCKTAVIDGTGKVLATTVVYPAKPFEKTEEAKKKLKPLIEKYGVEIIAIGNGTASRETEKFAAELIKETKKNILYIMVNEAGASIYSASKLASEEFPDFDANLRSAVSIGRRLQDPLAELVKIDPKGIGVGQYQHDMNQKKLGEALGGVVESCVNSVGVDLNTASSSLLSYVAGISSAVARNVVKYREENGKFTDRKQLLKVNKLGPKAYEQCAGFLRITDGANALDSTGVHPESYTAAEKLIAKLGYSNEDISKGGIKNIGSAVGDTAKLAEELDIGEPTLKDIIKELEKPGRDPRDEMPKPVLRQDVLTIDDLNEGMVLKGTVRNIVDFGAFVDIGIHSDGLVHISQMSEKRIKHPLEVVHVGDIIDVKVIGIDKKKEKVSLSMKGI